MPDGALHVCPVCGVLLAKGAYCPRHQAARFGPARVRPHWSLRYGGDWPTTRLRILARDRNLCQPCARAGLATTAVAVDHKLAKARGGGDDDANLEAVCRDCHRAKSNAELLRG